MQQLKIILNNLQSTPGKLAKQDIIKANLHNHLFVDVMKFLLNDFIVTGLSSKKIEKKFNLMVRNVQSIEGMINYLKTFNTGTDEDIQQIQGFMFKEELYSGLIKSIATKSLKLGVSAATWNKLVSEVDKLPVFNVMLAEKYFENEDKVKGDLIITTKLDGNRNVAIHELDGSVTMRTRQGMVNEGFDDVEAEIKNLPAGYVYDGEFIAVDDKGLHSSELYRETTSKVRKKGGTKTDVIFHIFDMIPIEDFRKGVCKTPCIDRKRNLNFFLSTYNFKWVKEVPMLYQGDDKSQIAKLLDEAISRGLEGVMVNIADAPYECKRTKSILKVKKMQTVDLEITGFEEGDGRLKGTLGRLNVDYKGFNVGIGSGFSDADRTFIWANRDSLLGRIVETQYFEESTNAKDKSLSLRFPVFKCIREEGKEISYF